MFAEILGPTDNVFIEQANDLHTGQYHCEAVNARGRDYLTYHIEVIGEIIGPLVRDGLVVKHWTGDTGFASSIPPDTNLNY